jgi:hypothetical protein
MTRAARDFARAAAVESEPGCCGPDDSRGSDNGVRGSRPHDDASPETVPDTAVNASLGRGVPTAAAELGEARSR